MYVVQCRVAGAIIDQEHCASLVDSWDAIQRRRRVLVNAGAAIVAEDLRQYVIARDSETWITVTLVDGEAH